MVLVLRIEVNIFESSCFFISREGDVAILRIQRFLFGRHYNRYSVININSLFMTSILSSNFYLFPALNAVSKKEFKREFFSLESSG